MSLIKISTRPSSSVYVSLVRDKGSKCTAHLEYACPKHLSGDRLIRSPHGRLAASLLVRLALLMLLPLLVLVLVLGNLPWTLTYQKCYHVAR